MSRGHYRACIVALATVLLILACGEGPYQQAGLGLATTVSFAAVNRAVTSDCWSQCSRGYACDRTRGLCVRAECVPDCALGEQCVIEQDGRFRCINAAALGQLRGGAIGSGNLTGGSVSSPPVEAGAAPSVGTLTDAGDAAAEQ